jgi:phospholipid transport system substrate-binding protein
MPAVAKYVLGGYWRQASEEQRKVFVDTFIEYMSVIYAKRFLEYSGQKLHVDNVRQNGPDMSTIYTTVENPNSQDNPRIDWVVRPEGDRWRILDVKIEGLSLTETHRNEFSAVIAHSGGIDGLIKTLQAKIQTDLAQKQ